jgi:hypothetical protein
MNRRTRHLLIAIGVPALLLLALGGWVVAAARKPFALRRRANNSTSTQRDGFEHIGDVDLGGQIRISRFAKRLSLE